MTGTATASAIDVGFANRRRATLVGALAPLLWAALTLLLIAAGRASPSWVLAAACLLIVGGAALAAGGLFARARN